jgi:hypothetical protein
MTSKDERDPGASRGLSFEHTTEVPYENSPSRLSAKRLRTANPLNANGDTDKKSVAARLVGMAREQYLLGVTDEGEPFGADRARPHLAMLLRGGRAGLRADLAARYFAETGAAAGGQALTDSTLILEGLAATQPPERLHLRVADHVGTIYIDTGRPAGQVIRIGQGRWAVTNTAPVRFLRTKLTGAMPLPPSDGDITRLWDFVNVDSEDRPVLLAVLVAALIQCDVPHPVLALFAEQGSAKSTTTRMLVDLIDPSPVPLRQAPRDADSWVTAASGSWVVALALIRGWVISSGRRRGCLEVRPGVAWWRVRDRLACTSFSLLRGSWGRAWDGGVDRDWSVGSGGAGLGGRVVVADDVVPQGFPLGLSGPVSG